MACVVALATVAIAARQPAAPVVVSAPAADPDAAYRENNLGVAELEQYNYESAVAAFRRALAIDAGNRLARINLAIALLYVPDPVEARKEATLAAERWADAPQPHYVLGLMPVAKTARPMPRAGSGASWRSTRPTSARA